MIWHFSLIDFPNFPNVLSCFPANLATFPPGLSSDRSVPLRVREDADHREECSLWQGPKTRQAPVEGVKGGKGV